MHAPNMPSSTMSDLDITFSVDYSWYARVALVNWMNTLQRSARLFPYLTLPSLSTAFHTPNEAEDEQTDSWRNFGQSYDRCPVGNGLRGNRFGRREQERARSLPLHQSSGLQKIWSKVLRSPSVTQVLTSHGYHSSSSTPGIPSALIPSLDFFPLGDPDRLPMFDSSADAMTAGEDPTGSASCYNRSGFQMELRSGSLDDG